VVRFFFFLENQNQKEKEEEEGKGKLNMKMIFFVVPSKLFSFHKIILDHSTHPIMGLMREREKRDEKNKISGRPTATFVIIPSAL